MPEYVDQTGKHVNLESFPKRIVSVVPSQTELLYDLGLDLEVAGITKFCVHPSLWYRSKQRVGGTKKLDLDLIRRLEPDLIIANKEENEKDQVLALQDQFPVWTSDIPNLDAALEMIEQVGLITNRIMEASRINDSIKKAFSHITPVTPPVHTAYLVWQEPYMTIGGDTFIHDMMARAGFTNIFGDKNRYPEIRLNELKGRGCDLLLLSSQPFPFSEKHAARFRELLPGVQIELVGGEMFSWYGSRLIKSPGYLNRIIDKIKANR